MVVAGEGIVPLPDAVPRFATNVPVHRCPLVVLAFVAVGAFPYVHA